jgi:hypothetical protein
MRKKQSIQKNNNLRLGYYFGFIVAVIIITSIIFKTVEVIRNSKFDGNNHINVVLLSKDSAQIFSFLPKDKKINYLKINESTSIESLKQKGIPIDGLVVSSQPSTDNPKNTFKKILLNYRKFDTNLSIIDIARLSLLSEGISSEKINSEVLTSIQDKQITNLASELFIDSALVEENLKIQITNTTKTQGLGNKIARQITNSGGNVVLVNSTQEEVAKSVINFTKDSYTLKRISKRLGIPIAKKDMNSISDIIIIIGKDKEDL